MSNLNEALPRAGAYRLALLALAIGVLAALALFLTGPGTRFGWWHFRTSFQMWRYGAYAGIAAMVLAVLAMAWGRTRVLLVAVPALLLGALAFGVPWMWRRSAQGYPPIHDITTDTSNPPAFVAIAPLRADAPNPVEYQGDSIARIQAEHYPDIQPLMMAMPTDSAFTLALLAAREMGWEIVDQDRASGRIEATTTTSWFAFRDDVVIRVSSASGIARVDVRSKSRVGRGDVGMNAKRIRAYVARLRDKQEVPVTAN